MATPARPLQVLAGFFLWVGTRSTHNFWVAALVPLNQNLREIVNILLLDPAPGMKILTQMPNADAFFWADIRLSSGFTFNDIADFL